MTTFSRECSASADPSARGTLAAKRALVLCAIPAIFLLFFHRLADRDLWSSHEARAAMDAESVLGGDWDLPHLNDGRAEMQKPPLYYWLVALTARLRGGTVDAWAVRLPATLSAARSSPRGLTAGCARGGARMRSLWSKASRPGSSVTAG